MATHPTNNQPPATSREQLEGQARFGLLDIMITLQIRAEPESHATGVARSAMSEGRRLIRVSLNTSHLIVSRALIKGDVVIIKFLIGLTLNEFGVFWSPRAADGRGVVKALKLLAGLTKGDQAWGSGFATRLGLSPAMQAVDNLPIFTRVPPDSIFELFAFETPQRSPSDIPNWRQRAGQSEEVKSLPPKQAKPALTPAPEPHVPAQPDPFLRVFYERAKDLLSSEDFGVLEELAKGVPADV